MVSANPMMTIHAEKMTVRSAAFGEYRVRACAMIPPVDAPTTSVTTGSSQVRLMDSRVSSWCVILDGRL